MDEAAIIQHIEGTFDGVDVERPGPGSEAPEIAWGDTFFIYDPHRNFEARHRFPFATIVTKDYGDFDRLSDLNRPGVFRLNVGVSKDTYHSLFGPPKDVADAGHDYTALDRLMPHPVYAAQYWVCVLNPGDATFLSMQPLLADAYALAVRRRARAQAGNDS